MSPAHDTWCAASAQELRCLVHAASASPEPIRPDQVVSTAAGICWACKHATILKIETLLTRARLPHLRRLLVESVTVGSCLGSCWRMHSLSGGDVPDRVRSATRSSLIENLRNTRAWLFLQSFTNCTSRQPLQWHLVRIAIGPVARSFHFLSLPLLPWHFVEIASLALAHTHTHTHT